jgi:NAD(P)-dependent dehydrogenase (short-subunit alcohol dehydrogenase family)
MGRLTGRNVVVTGGARGIGAGIVRRYVEEGARCIIADIDIEVGQAVADELGDAAVFIRTDVSRDSDVQDAVSACVEQFGAIDVMVNNAGIVGVTGPIAETDPADWDRTLAVLLTSVFLGIRAAVPHMRTAGRGSIINTSSTAGIQGGLGPHVYTAAKHGVIGLTKSVAVEMAPYGVRVNALCPGATVSSLTAAVVTGDRDNMEEAAKLMGAKYASGRAPMPSDLADAALFLASDESTFVNGTALIVDSGKEVLAATARERFYPA